MDKNLEAPLSTSECVWLVRPTNGDVAARATLVNNCIRGIHLSRRKITDGNNEANHRLWWECDGKTVDEFLKPDTPLLGKYSIYRLFPNGEHPHTAELFLAVG